MCSQRPRCDARSAPFWGYNFRILQTLPIVSIVVPFGGYPFGIPNIEPVKPEKGTTMVGSDEFECFGGVISVLQDFRVACIGFGEAPI